MNSQSLLFMAVTPSEVEGSAINNNKKPNQIPRVPRDDRFGFLGFQIFSFLRN